MSDSDSAIGLHHPRCPFCHDGVAPHQAKTACDSCMSWHHSECWKQHGACAACSSASAVGALPGRPRRPPGRGTDPRSSARGACPSCGSGIQLSLLGGGCCGWRWIPLDWLDEAIANQGARHAQRRWDEVVATGGLDASVGVPCPRCGEEAPVWRLAGVLALSYCRGHGLWTRSDGLSLLRAMPDRDASAWRSLVSQLGTLDPPVDERLPRPDPKAP